ncbi:M56 family metallopeptidase [Roseivirga sp.]|uniref:M56 family metallopeptidase n=1 Tax=Roseivirga sp. TaxID=1964215 RepID=UPI003B52DDB6
MNPVLLWSLKAGALLFIVFSFYYFLFRYNTEYTLKRALLMILLIICSIAPFIEIGVSDQQPRVIKEAYEMMPLGIRQSLEPETHTEISIVSAESSKKRAIDWNHTFQWLYLSGLAVSFIILLIDLGKILRLLLIAKKDNISGITVWKHSSVKSPFSFGSWIFIPAESVYSETAWSIIAQHETVHINQKHSLDLLLCRIIQAFQWYNPMIYLLQKELKVVHEALADEQVLRQFDFNTYAETLMSVSLATRQFKLIHSFALKSSLSKRISLMKTHKTKIQKTILVLTIFLISVTGLIGWTSLKAQDKDEIDSEITVEQVDAKIQELMSFPFKIGLINKLSKEHKQAFVRLKEENPDKSIRYRYFEKGDFSMYFDAYEPGYKPIYIDEVSDDQKLEVFNLVQQDTSKISVNLNKNGKSSPMYYTYSETVPDLKEIILANANYLMIYEATPTKLADDGIIYSINEVEKQPEVIGGLDNLAKSIALNITIPEDLATNKLPETVDFEFVVRGGKSISHLNLLTELNGSEKENLAYYRFFGKVHDELRSKISSIYPWKRGIKDGKEVLVRVKIAIPTKYMM